MNVNDNINEQLTFIQVFILFLLSLEFFDQHSLQSRIVFTWMTRQNKQKKKFFE